MREDIASIRHHDHIEVAILVLLDGETENDSSERVYLILKGLDDPLLQVLSETQQVLITGGASESLVMRFAQELQQFLVKNLLHVENNMANGFCLKTIAFSLSIQVAGEQSNDLSEIFSR